MGVSDSLPRAPPKPSRGMLQLGLLLLIAVSVSAQKDPCQTNAVVPKEVAVNFETNRCKLAWTDKSFVVRYADNTTTLSMVVSVAKDSSRWYGVGFNGARFMEKASAMIAWVDPTTGEGQISQYYLGAKLESQVKLDFQIKFTQLPRAIPTADSIYMVFQIDKVASKGVSFDYQLYAYGFDGRLPASTGALEVHEGKTVVRFDYTSGTVTASYSDPSRLRRSHGIINIFGWGILLPVGAIIARYCRPWDPAWFYLHIALQILGYVLILVALVLGIRLTDKVPGADFHTHRGLGIFVFVLATLQIMAVLIRPKKDAKIRRYWNWYHHWAGRIALLIAAINVYIGIHVAQGGRKWKASYGLVLVIELVVVVVLEILLWLNKASDKEPTLQLGGGNFQEQSYPNSAPPPYDSYRNSQI